MNPSRMDRALTRASEHNIRMTSDSEVISRLNTPTGCRSLMTTCSAMFITSEVLPIEGRAAMTIISPPFMPLVILS